MPTLLTTTLRTAGGDLVIPRVIVTDRAAVARQKILDGLNLFKGEWFLNQLDGFPWFQSVFGVKLVNATQVAALLRKFLLGVPYVGSVVASSNFDRVRRNFDYNFNAFLTNGLGQLQGAGSSAGAPTVAIVGGP